MCLKGGTNHGVFGPNEASYAFAIFMNRFNGSNKGRFFHLFFFQELTGRIPTFSEIARETSKCVGVLTYKNKLGAHLQAGVFMYNNNVCSLCMHERALSRP